MSATHPPYHHKPNGGFRNPPGSPARSHSFGDMASFLYQQLTKVRAPDCPEGHRLGKAEVLRQMAGAGNPSVTWLGHAAFLIRMGGLTILTDPFLGDRAGPFGFGPKRFVAPALRADELPKVDVVLLSHNHYDHLDIGALKAIRDKDSVTVVVPLGLGARLARYGFPTVFEQDWWDRLDIGALTITTLPAVHFSSRGLFDRDRTLWASFAIDSGTERLWFSGDTAAGEVFHQIGRRAGPFDLALITIGAYEPQKIMKSFHVTPEDAVWILRTIGARKALGMHWGSIMLTPEDPFEAPIWFRRAAADQGYGAVNVSTPRIGETRMIERRP